MSTPNIQQLCLTKVDEIESEACWYQQSDGQCDGMHSVIRALRSVIVATFTNGYTTWDKSMVPMVDGKYDKIEADKWELHHGHDIRSKCYAEYGCQLLIDPSELMQDIAKELEL